MEFSRAFIAFLLILIISRGKTADALSIGTAPGVLDLGEVKPGSDKLVEFYLTTNSKSDLLIGMGYINVHGTIFDKNHTGTYTFLPPEASEEDISNWLSFPQKKVLVSPSRSFVVNLQDGGVARVNKKITAVLHVPKDADPGYHAGAINLFPEVPDGTGMGLMTMGITRMVFVFDVEGEAKREGKVVTIEAERSDKNKARFDILFQNTGTSTVMAYAENVKIYNEFGNLTTTLRSGQALVKPQQTAILSAYWNSREPIKSGSYRVETAVDYKTGMAIGEAVVNIPDTITAPILERSEKGCKMPWTIIILILLIALLVYWKKPTEIWSIIIGLLVLIDAIILYTSAKTCGFSLNPIHMIPSWLLIIIISLVGLYVYWRS